MEPARLQMSGEGWAVGQTPSHPEGIIFSGGYDAETNTVHLAGVAGHPLKLKQICPRMTRIYANQLEGNKK